MVPELEIARSIFPSPLKSAETISEGFVPPGKLIGDCSVSVPGGEVLFRKINNLFEFPITATSSCPSLLKSPRVKAVGSAVPPRG